MIPGKNAKNYQSPGVSDMLRIILQNANLFQPDMNDFRQRNHIRFEYTPHGAVSQQK
jgi:hypothetical protein